MSNSSVGDKKMTSFVIRHQLKFCPLWLRRLSDFNHIRQTSARITFNALDC